MRVLIVKTSSMGDVLHTLPALTDAIHAIPGIRFDWVVEENFAQIPHWHPGVDRVIPVAIRRWRKNWFSRATRKERQDFRQRLRQNSYDYVIDAQGLLKSAALITRLVQGTKCGLDCKSAREPLASFFYQHRFFVDKQQHAVERVRELFALALGYVKPEEQGDYAIAQRFLAAQSPVVEHYVVLLHSTTREDKHWPEEHWRQLIQQLVDTGLTIKLPWGTTREQQRAQRLAAGFAHVEVLPKLSLEQVAQVLAGATGVISVDTGLSHMAAALDKPNITLYGPTDPGLIGGYGKNQTVCRSLSKNLQDLDAAEVMRLWQQE